MFMRKKTRIKMCDTIHAIENHCLSDDVHKEEFDRYLDGYLAMSKDCANRKGFYEKLEDFFGKVMIIAFVKYLPEPDYILTFSRVVSDALQTQWPVDYRYEMLGIFERLMVHAL